MAAVGKPATSRPDHGATPTGASTSIEEELPGSIYNIECKRSSNINGAFSFRECKLTLIKGPEIVANPSGGQHVGGIVFDGVRPIDGGEARDINQSGTLNVAPFGSIYSNAPAGNATAVRK